MSSPALVAATETEPTAEDAPAGAAVLRELLRKPRFVLSGVVILVIVAMAAFPRLFTSADPTACNLRYSKIGPSAAHWFGYDIQGCDYFANVIYGARPSVLVSVSVSLVGFVVACTLGMLAGYFPGFVDGLVSRTADVLFALPGLVAMIVILQAFSARSVWTIAFVIVLLGWPAGMRLMRSTVLSVRSREYVLAARVLGATAPHILRKHIFPNSVAPLLSLTTLSVGVAVGTEAALTFLGIGLQPPTISWGLQIAIAASYRDDIHLFVFPALFLTLTVMSFMMMGDTVRDALDPKLRR
ncbi:MULTISPECIES: ABC transporter permease [unclassified Streptomyces]|uniref:ABC transporter permease n=1 Tax=unclassified Streptomyces TaxID=2593676 RepID=UPI003BB4EAF4